MDMADLRFDDQGLIPAVVIDGLTGEVLTLAYMNEESLAISMREGRTCFYSRSRQTLWRKGETSGHVQYIQKIVADCDGDALAVYVTKDGPACHTGRESCFYQELYEASQPQIFAAKNLYRLLKDRQQTMPEGSYTTYLFAKGLDKILKKVGEESTEVIIAGKAEDRRETVYEIADLYYHVMVLMARLDIKPSEVARELASRHIIDHKVKQEKMT